MRLNKYIASSGYCSRREADRLIESRRVKINGKTAELGQRVEDGDLVEVDGKAIYENKNKIYLAFNKPVGIVCTTEKKEKDNIVDYINHRERIYPIGRLDKDSEGLIFLTNDGDIVNKILRQEYKKEKEYIVTVDRKINEKFLKQMAQGVEIYNPVRDEKVRTNKCRIEKLTNRKFKIIISQGLNRQIRRMCEALGYNVETLKRIRISNIKLGELPIGKYRYLNEIELKGLLKGKRRE
ncbi:MAG: pseudouridine synthase [Andreesenia angusta]|nr:pseudouridine synthase [Andreesenia angusta]